MFKYFTWKKVWTRKKNIKLDVQQCIENRFRELGVLVSGTGYHFYTMPDVFSEKLDFQIKKFELLWKILNEIKFCFKKRRRILRESVSVCSFSGLLFPAFGLNTKRYSVSLAQMRENADENNSEYGLFLRSVSLLKKPVHVLLAYPKKNAYAKLNVIYIPMLLHLTCPA